MSTRIDGTFRQILLLLACAVAFFGSPGLVHAQQDQEAEGLCFPGAGKTVVVRGGIGGETHVSYLLHLREGRKLTVTLTSTGNHAQFTVSTTEFGEQVSFGKESNNGRTWTGTIPQTGVYFISLVSHPASRYALKVTKE